MTLEIREFEIREVNKEERTITGIAVPYGQTVNVGGYKESFERGAFEDDADATLFYGHDHRNGGLPIGKLVTGRNTEAGYEVTARLSETPKGNEVYQLLKDGVLNKFSVGFEPIKSQTRDGVVVRTKALLREVSVVPMPAYAGAVIAEVRDTTNNKENEIMSNDTHDSEVVELREAVNDLERKFAVLGENASAKNEGGNYRHAGEMLKALAANDESARMEVRAFTGATTADSIATPAWVSERLRLQVEGRDTLNLFRKGGLPSTGNSVEYPVVTGATGTVGVQATEGADLPYMEVTLGTATAPVKTYGGYTSLSRQAIERSDVAFLETTLEFMARQYAKATNTAVRTAFVGATGTNTGTLATTTAKGSDWISLFVNSAALIDDNSKGSQAEFALLSRDVYLKLVALNDTSNRPVFDINGDGSNTVGNLSVGSFKGSLAGIPLVVDNGLAANSLFIASGDAVKVFESAGAPFRLQDENIINLTKDFSLYGYMAVAVQNPLAVVKVTVS